MQLQRGKRLRLQDRLVELEEEHAHERLSRIEVERIAVLIDVTAHRFRLDGLSHSRRRFFGKRLSCALLRAGSRAPREYQTRKDAGEDFG